MNYKTESQRNKFITKYNIKIGKYTTNEIVDELEENISNVFLFALNILLPIIITCLISITLSVYFGYSYHSVIFGILFFLFSIPIFLFGAGSFGVIRAVKNLFSCVNYILNYTLNVVTDIKKINKTNGNEKNSDIFEFTLYGVVFPVTKKIARNNIFGQLLNFFIEKMSIRGSKLLCDSYEEYKQPLEIKEIKEIEISSSEKLFKKIPSKINDISKKVFANVILIVKVFGVASIIFGVILELLLFFIY